MRHANMTPGQLWSAVGKILERQRARKNWNYSDVQRAGGPNYHTVQSNERGELSSLDKLTLHADALGISIVDVFMIALDRSADPVSADVAALIRWYEGMAPAARQALLTIAQHLSHSTPPAGDAP